MLIGHAGHEEVEGTMGEAPEHIVLVETEADVDALEVARSRRRSPTSRRRRCRSTRRRAIIARLRESFPAIIGPRTDDICYATTNRQARGQADGRASATSCSSSARATRRTRNRLVDVARDMGAEAHLIDNEAQVREEWLDGKRVVGITSGASAPEELVQRLVDFFRARGTRDVAEFEVMREDVRFMLPKTIRQEMAAQAADRPGASGGHRTQPGADVVAVLVERAAGGGAIGGRSPSRRSGGAGSGTPSASATGSMPELLGEREGLGDVVDRARRARRPRAAASTQCVGRAARANAASSALGRARRRARRARRWWRSARRAAARAAPTASHSRANRRSLPTATAIGRSAAS